MRMSVVVNQNYFLKTRRGIIQKKAAYQYDVTSCNAACVSGDLEVGIEIWLEREIICHYFP